MSQYTGGTHLSPRMSTHDSTGAPLPAPPRRILVGASSAEAVAARIRAARSDLDLRAVPHTAITAEDLAWADAYVGFRRPSAAALGGVRWVHSTGAGVDPWLVPGALPETILLTRSPQSFGPPIAEWTLARMLAFTQALPALSAAQMVARWAEPSVRALAGTRALIVGTGDIGGTIARVLTPLGVDVIGVSRSGTAMPGVFREVHRTEALPELVPHCDWLIVVVPDTPATRGLISRDLLARCRGAVLLNAGRGATVEESAIPEALEAGCLRGAALDVFETEPLPPDSPLWRDPRVMISPHCSGLTTVEGAADGFLECLALIERGERPRWAIDRVRGY